MASALLGIGGGTIKVPLMHLAMGVPLRVATATSNLMMGITAASGAVIYLLRGEIDPYVVGPTAIGVFVGATLGSRVAHRIGLRYLRLLFVVVIGVHGDPDAAAGRLVTRVPDRAPERGREFDRFIGRLLIAVTYVAVGLLSVGVVLMLAAGISPLAGGPPLDPGTHPGGPPVARAGGVPVAGDPRRHRHADQPGHRGGDRVRPPGRSLDGRRLARDPRGHRARDRLGARGGLTRRSRGSAESRCYTRPTSPPRDRVAPVSAGVPAE